MNLNNLIQYCREFELPDPLEGIYVPAPINPEAVRSAIIVRCGLLTPVYGEPDLFRQTVKDWFFYKQWTFHHLIKIIEAEYSPIENFDRYEDYTDSNNGEISRSKKGQDNNTGGYTNQESGKDSTSNNGGSTDNINRTEITENTISADNSSTYQPDNKSTKTTNETDTNIHNDDTVVNYGKKLTNTHTDTTKREEDELTKNVGDSHHVGHLHGNIGVTTNQQMIEQELELLRHFDIYKFIADEFEKENMLMIY